MEFDFDVHKIFLDPITKLDSSLIPVRRPLISSFEAQKQITKVIDEIGKASAKAQRLPVPITSASRMQTNQHHLYILKDCTAKTAGRGVVIGFLKVGYKKLFVLDHKGSHIEAEPLCILDFYIHESLQRHGFGKEVFNFMLRTEQVEPQHLAIDRPSEKFTSFLKKHYNLRSTIPQVNNFVIFEGFFRDRKAPVRKLPPKRPEGDIKPYSLSDREFLKHDEGLPWPLSQSPSYLNRAGSLGSSPTRARPYPGEDDFMKSLRVCRPHSLHRAANGEQEESSQRRRTSDTNLSRGLLAQRNCYSRYTSSSPPLLRRAPPAEDNKEKHLDTDKSKNKNETSDVASVNLNDQLTSDQHYPFVKQKPQQQATSHSKQEPPEEKKSLEKAEDHNNTSVHDGSRTPLMEQPSWTVLGTVTNAQWVRRKQEMRGTRPCKNKNETSDVASVNLNDQLTSDQHYPFVKQKPQQQATSHSKQEPPEEKKSLEKAEDHNNTSVHDGSRTPLMEQPSWTVLGTVTNAQWVRRKQEMRGTRPCKNKNETSDVASVNLNDQLTSDQHYPFVKQKPQQQATSHSKQEPPEEKKSLEKAEDHNNTSVHDGSRTPLMEQPSWTVLGTVTNAQWVRRKQEMRGTRPW